MESEVRLLMPHNPIQTPNPSIGMHSINPSVATRQRKTPRRLLAGLLTMAACAVMPLSAQTLSYNFNGGLQGWTQILPTPPGILHENSALGAYHDGWDVGINDFTTFGRSPAFYLTNPPAPLSFRLAGGQSPLDFPAAPSEIPAAAILSGGFAGVALRDVETNTYVLARRKSGNGGEWVAFEFSPSELAPYRNNGRQYTLDYIDYNRGGWGWTYLDDVVIPGIEIEPPAPTNLTITAGSSALVIEWSPTPRATSYTIERSIGGGGVFTPVGQTLAPTFTDGGLDPGVLHTYRVIAENLAGLSPLSDEVSGTPAGGPESTAKDILSFSFGSLGTARISGTTITKYVSPNVDITALAPTYTTSLFAAGNPKPGTARDFSTAQSYTITAEDGSTKTYSVAITLVSPLTYDFNSGLQGWSQLLPFSAILWNNGVLGAGYDNDDPYSRHGRSPGFYLLDSGPLTFSLDGGQSPLAAPHVGPSEIPENAINAGGFAGVALRDVESNTYVLSRRKPANGGPMALEFTPAELAPYTNNGRQYTLDYLDYNSGGWGWTYLDNVSIPGMIDRPGTTAEITSIRIGAHSASETNGNEITIWLPDKTPVNALAPLIAISPEASISPASGATRDFTEPQDYVVTSGDGEVVNTYTVTVVAAGSLTVKTFDTLFGSNYLAPISNLMSATPTATGIQVDDIFYSDFVGPLPGITENEQFSVLWEGWFNVAIDGPGIHTFGTQSDDGSMIYLDLNGDGDFSDPGELVVNNNGDHGYDIRTGSVDLQMDAVRMVIGYYEWGGGQGMDARFRRGTGLDFSSLQRIGGKTGHFTIDRPPYDPSFAGMWNVAVGTNRATSKKDSLFITLPPGSDVTAVAPTFLVSTGAVSVPPSGTVRDFSTPQIYTVTSEDGSTVTEFELIIRAQGALNVKTFDTLFGTTLLDPISNLQAQTPSASFTAPNDILFNVFDPTTPGLTNGDQFSFLWEGWFDVAADGPGHYTFATRSDDGSVIYLDLNGDGDFDDPGELIVGNNRLQPPTINTATVWLPMDSVRIAIGYFEDGGGEAMEARYGKGGGLAFAEMDLIGGNIGTFLLEQPPARASSAAMWYFNHYGPPASVDGTNFLLAVPVGTDLTTLDPVFQISPGATSVPPSGTARDFTTPKTYSVTSQDGSTTTVYTVGVYQLANYNFDLGTLEGWYNRVWDLAANGGAGGWIDLAPNAFTMPFTVNGGAIQPPSADNGLFAPINGQVRVNGHIDNHLNTHWLRSPAFVLDSVADLTVDLGMGIANSFDPLDESEVSHEAITGGGWKGVALRRVSDGAFVITKPRSGANGDEFRTVTFTRAELEIYDGVECTLELINADRGSWGWLAMDRVSIPVKSMVALSPYDAWRANYPALVGAAAAPGADADGDGDTNLEELAFNTNPGSGAIDTLAFESGFVTSYGRPLLSEEGGKAIIYGRRMDRADHGLTYTVQFSHDLDHWVDNTAAPEVIADDGIIEAVRVPFPATIATPQGDQEPRFARVRVVKQ